VKTQPVRKPADVYSFVQCIAVMMYSSETEVQEKGPLLIVSYCDV